MTPYAWSENHQVDIAMRQLEDFGVPCDCPLCISAYYRLQRIQQEKEERDLRRPSRDFVLYNQEFTLEYSYIDCLREETEILQLMLC